MTSTALQSNEHLSEQAGEAKLIKTRLESASRLFLKAIHTSSSCVVKGHAAYKRQKAHLRYTLTPSYEIQ